MKEQSASNMKIDQLSTRQVALRRAEGDGLDGGLVACEAVEHLSGLDVPNLKMPFIMSGA